MQRKETKKAKEAITKIFRENGFLKKDLINLTGVLYGANLKARAIREAIEELKKEEKIRVIISKGREFLEWQKQRSFSFQDPGKKRTFVSDQKHSKIKNKIKKKI